MTVRRDIKLTADWDLDVSGQDLQHVSDADAIVQSVKIHLQLFLGEWFADTSVGMPYFQEIFGKGKNVNALASIFRRQILAVPGITEVMSLSLAFDAADRTLAVTFTAKGDVDVLEPQTVELTV